MKSQNALAACLRARESWRAAGCPGQQDQLAFFTERDYSPPEVIKGLRADRPRQNLRRTRTQA